MTHVGIPPPIAQEDAGAAFLETCKALAVQHASEMMTAKQLTELGMLLMMIEWQPDDLVVEIGTYHGQTSAYMARVLRAIGHARVPVVAVDPFEFGPSLPTAANPKGHFATYAETIRQYALENQCFCLATISSRAAVLFPSQIALLVVDGRHTYEDCLADLTLYIPKVRPGGFAVIDDDTPESYPGVVQAVTDYFADRPDLGIRRGGTHAVVRC